MFYVASVEHNSCSSSWLLTIFCILSMKLSMVSKPFSSEHKQIWQWCHNYARYFTTICRDKVYWEWWCGNLPSLGIVWPLGWWITTGSTNDSRSAVPNALRKSFSPETHGTLLIPLEKILIQLIVLYIMVNVWQIVNRFSIFMKEEFY